MWRSFSKSLWTCVEIFKIEIFVKNQFKKKTRKLEQVESWNLDMIYREGGGNNGENWKTILPQTAFWEACKRSCKAQNTIFWQKIFELKD